MVGVISHKSCRGLCQRLQILTLPREYIFSSLNFITNNEEHFQTNAGVHSINTKHKHYIHKPTANLSCFQKSACYAGIKIFSNLPSDLEVLWTKTRFKTTLKQYLYTQLFYSVDEYLLSKKLLIHLKVV
jgi:hypothetical protein